MAKNNMLAWCATETIDNAFELTDFEGGKHQLFHIFLMLKTMFLPVSWQPLGVSCLGAALASGCCRAPFTTILCQVGRFSARDQYNVETSA